MSMNEEDRERTSMDSEPRRPRTRCSGVRRPKRVAEAAGIGGPRPDYENEEDLSASEAERLYEGGEGVEEGFEIAEDDLEEAATRGESRYAPREHGFGDEESAGDADAIGSEPDEIDVTETVRDPDAGVDDDPGEAGILHDR